VDKEGDVAPSKVDKDGDVSLRKMDNTERRLEVAG
jgi:hypothetical protein